MDPAKPASDPPADRRREANPPAEAAGEPARYFDSLVHVTADGAWIGGRKHDASAERLLAELGRCAPWRACLVAIADYIDNQTVLQAAKLRPGRLVPIGSINPVSSGNEPEVARRVGELSAAGFAGLKLHPRLNGYDPLDRRVVAAMRAAGAAGLVVFLDTLFRQPRVTTLAAPDVVDALAVACPETTIICLHGGGAQLLAMSEVVAAHANLVLDISFSVLRYAGSSLDVDLRYLLRTFDRRIVIGSDFPEYLPFDTLMRVENLSEGIDAARHENVLCGNLTRLFASWTAAQR
jgi:predicted TIM-barrel fold metal-dependent hydrolase